MNKITFPLKKLMQGPEVADLQDALKLMLEREAIYPENPRARAALMAKLPSERQSQTYGSATNKIVAVFQKQWQMRPDGIVGKQTADAINALLKRWGVLDQPNEPEIPQYRVEGQIQQADATPLAGTLVRAFDKDLRHEQLLGETQTDRQGRYSINYTTAQFRRAEKKNADLIVRVIGPDGGILVESALIFNAQPVEVIDLALTDDLQERSEYERLHAELVTLLEGLSFAELTEKDVSFLVGETGIERQLINALVSAAKLEVATELPATVYYGLIRENLPAELFALLRQSQDTQRQALQAAIEKKLVPAMSPETLDAILDRLQDLLLEFTLEEVEDPIKPSLNGLMATTLLPLSRNQKKAFLKLYLRAAKPTEDIWETLREDPEFHQTGLADELKVTVQVGNLTQNHLPLVRTLQQMRKAGQVVAFRELARLTIEKDWIKLIDQSREEQSLVVPSNISGETERERVRNYAQQIAERLEEVFPTLSIAYRVEQDELPGRDALMPFFNRSIIHRESLNPDVPEFDFATTHVDRYLEKHADDLLTDVPERQLLRRQLKIMQRLFRVTPYYAELKPLLANNLHSAQSIVRLGPGQFVKRFAEDFGSEARAAELYDKAEHLNAMAMAVLTKYGTAFNGVAPAFVPKAPQPSDEELEAIPDWPSLFGSLDFCACKHCQSVYSPAAYLVDVLHFLDTTCPAKDSSKTAKDILFERRGDLGKIELTCANTNTPVPYIDLVNEILENTVAKPIPGTPYPQTRDTAEEIAANPEYVNAEAYETLSNQVFPWGLPYDRWAEECRVYLQQLGTQRYQLMEVYSEKSRAECLNDWAIAREYLGLNFREWSIITGFEGQVIPRLSQYPIWEYWGYDKSPEPAGWTEDVSQVPVFLKKSGLSHPQLLEVLATRFVNPDPAQRILDISPDDACRLEDMTLFPQANLTQIRLNVIHRFIRLQRKLGWTMRELDQAVTALKPKNSHGVTIPSGVFLVQLSHIERLRKDLNLSVVQVLSFWSDIDTAPYDVGEQGASRSLYDKLFQNKTLLSNEDDRAVFASNNVTATFSEHGSILEAVLGISESDLEELKATTRLPGHPDTALPNQLSLTSLSILYRHVLLAKNQRLTISELLTLKSLFAMDPFDSDHTENILLFVEKLQRIREAEFSVAQLNYLYRNIDDPVKSIAPSAQDSIKLPQTLLDELNRISEETKIVVVSEDLFRTHMATVFDELQIRDAVAFLDSSLTDTPQNRETITGLFGLFLPEVPDYTRILASSEPQSEQEKETLKEKAITCLLEYLVAYIRDLQSRTAIKQVLSETLNLDKLVTTSLLDTILLSRGNPGGLGKYAIDDFLALKNAGLLATYTGEDSQGNTKDVLRSDPYIDFDWGTASPVEEFLADSFNQVTWEGKLLAPTSEVYIFHIDVVGSVELELNGELLALSSSTGNSPLISPPISLMAGVLSAIRLTYTHSAGEKSRVRLSWSSPSTSESVIPQNLLYPDDAYDYLAQSYCLLWKAALLITNFKMTAKEIEYLSQHSGDFDGFDFNSLPLASVTSPSNSSLLRQWERLHEFVHLRDSLPSSEVGLTDVFALAAKPSEAIEKLAQATGWDIQQLSGLTTDELKNEVHLIRLRDELALSYRLGVMSDNLRNWCQYPSKGVAAQNQAQAIKNALKARYEDDQWLAVAKPLKNQLREQQRSALVAYLLSQPQSLGKNNLEDTNDLYDHLLIDVEMSACQMTSRIKQANSAIQLFVQRCLMGLEKEAVFLDESAANQWKWMKNYRVWEANRKVFLYPENWIEPELRDDKSPFFKDMENDLLQGEINLDTVETAFRNYLEKLDEVALLDVRGMYWQVEPGVKGVNILHVFARTKGGDPYIYFYRQWVDGSYWTPWEKVNVDIKGDHLVPVVYNRRLRLYWPIFEEKAEADVDTTSEEPPKLHWEIKIAWSEYKNKKWSAKKVSDGGIHSEDREEFVHRLQYTKDQYFFLPVHRPERDMLSILCFEKPPIKPISPFFNLYGDGSPEHPFWHKYCFPNSDTQLGGFDFVGCHDTIYLFKLTRWFNDQKFIFNTYTQEFYDDVYNIPEVAFKEPTRINEWHTLHEVMWWYNHLLPRLPRRGAYMNEALVETVSDNAKDDALVFGVYYYLMWATPGQFYLCFPNQYGPLEFDLDIILSQQSDPYNPIDRQMFQSFFYQDNTRNLFLTPVPKIESNKEVVWKKHNIFYHPYSCRFISELNRHGIDGILDPPDQASDLKRQLCHNIFFKTQYKPGKAEEPYPIEWIDFMPSGSYSLYNWELFFYAPLMIADRLMKNQRFEEAQKWFHYIFDPTIDSDPINIPQRFEDIQNWCKDVLNIVGIDYDDEASARRFWKIQPFFLNSFDQISINQLMELLAYKGNEPGGSMARTFLKTIVDQWREDPFKPHLIARMRISAYQKTVVMKYLDNLISWADNLFRRDTMESINEATQLYILAAKILGPRPTEIQPRKTLPVQTYDDLETKLDAFSNAVVQIENQLYTPITLRSKNQPLSFQQKSVVSETQHSAWSSVSATLTSPSLYFCIPPNEDMLEYWDTISDRMFKVRHCMNMEGVTRQLPLFEPPINPALLVKAAAAGLDIGSVLQDLYAPLPKYRFQFMLQKSLELCHEVKALGAALLSAVEKKDAESLSLLRTSNELDLLNYAIQLKEKQIEEAKESVTALNRAKALATARKQHYSQLLSGVTADIAGLPLNLWETASLGLNSAAIITHTMGTLLDLAAAVAHSAPDTTAGSSGMGPCATVTIGGSSAGVAITASSQSLKDAAAAMNMGANLSNSIGGFERRKEEWELQLKLAKGEELHIQQQIVVATIRQEIAEQELAYHTKQIEKAESVKTFMQDKFTNQELYSWMVSQISGVYFQSYKLAYDTAKQAERTYGYELGLEDTNYIQYGYWDSLHKGLLAGEKLFHDLKRLEMAHLEKNKREYELTKHVSLLQLDPMALISLRETGRCTFNVPEELLDMDFPGHYFRRIKTVALSIPCVTGPYTGVNSSLTLSKSRIRTKSTGSYLYEGVEDTKFTHRFGSIESIVTSSGQNDSGLFETNLRDERYLPFEGSGAISEWQLQLPGDPSKTDPDPCQFDYQTISDVILHIRYTAREGGGTLRKEALDNLNKAIKETKAAGSVRLFSVRHEFPSEWAKFKSETLLDGQRHELSLNLRTEHYPFWSQGRLESVKQIQLLAKSTQGSLTVYDEPEGDSKYCTLTCGPESLGDLLTNAVQTDKLPDSPVTTVKLYFDGNEMSNLWLAVMWSSD